jgi:hypothetical protein
MSGLNESSMQQSMKCNYRQIGVPHCYHQAHPVLLVLPAGAVSRACTSATHTGHHSLIITAWQSAATMRHAVKPAD